jgi:hypothetical protein
MKRMFPRKFRMARILAVLVVAGAVAGGSYAFTASNTVGTSPAGYGESGAVTGYTATNVAWALNSTSPDKIASVSFTLSTVTASTAVYAGADNGTTVQWSSVCSQGAIVAGAATETCTFATQPTTQGVIKLAVAAAN